MTHLCVYRDYSSVCHNVCTLYWILCVYIAWLEPTKNVTPPKSTRFRNSNIQVQIQIEPKSQFEYCTVRYRGIWVFRSDRFRGWSFTSGNCRMHTPSWFICNLSFLRILSFSIPGMQLYQWKRSWWILRHGLFIIWVARGIRVSRFSGFWGCSCISGNCDAGYSRHGLFAINTMSLLMYKRILMHTRNILTNTPYAYVHIHMHIHIHMHMCNGCCVITNEHTNYNVHPKYTNTHTIYIYAYIHIHIPHHIHICIYTYIHTYTYIYM